MNTTLNPQPYDSLTFSCRKIFIHQLKLDCWIGAYAHEKQHPQQVLFDCEVWISLQDSTSSSDDLSDVLNYDVLVNQMTEIALAQHYNLQETLVDTIADKLINLPGIQLLRLTSAKTEAYDNVQAVGIEVWRRKHS